MDFAPVLATYDEEYARRYDATFILDPHYRAKTRFELDTLARLLDGREPWLDVACGTGYFLSRFPGTRRAGLDLSPAMLDVARRANPSALLFRQASFCDEIPEWVGKWGLVSCMWYSYGYASSIAALRALVRNLARWTSDSGACFVPVCDPENLGRGIRVPYRHAGSGFPPAPLRITGVTWTWNEPSGKHHPDMVAPPVDAMVDVVPYPRFHWWTRRRRKAIVARERRPLPAIG